MSPNNNNTKQRIFQHIDLKNRIKIELLLKLGIKKVNIAKELNIPYSTLYKKLERGIVKQIDTNLKKYKKYFTDIGLMNYKKIKEIVKEL